MVSYSLGVVGILVALVQTVVIRFTMPKARTLSVVYISRFSFYTVGLIFLLKGWMMFAFNSLCLGGLANPTLQSIITGQVPRMHKENYKGPLHRL